MFTALRRYLLSGLLVWIPIWVTFLLVRFLVHFLNNAYNSMPVKFHLVNLIGVKIPGIGIIFTLLLLFLTGVVAANFFGKKIVGLWDKLIGKIPLVRSIYSAVKQVLDTMFSSDGKAFRKVLLVEYPRKGLWSIAFQTGAGGKEVNKLIGDDDVVTIFIPTTPNPTSGFLMMVPRKDVHELDMPVDQALKFVISLGVVQPGAKVLEKKA
jgi:uncharacterized membrane protein